MFLNAVFAGLTTLRFHSAAIGAFLAFSRYQKASAIFEMLANTRIRILSVEDHPVFRAGLRLIVDSQTDMEIVAQASNLDEATAEFQRVTPDVTVMDVHLPGAKCTEALSELRKLCPTTPVVMLVTCDSEAHIYGAMEEDAIRYVLKCVPRHDLAALIRTAHSDKAHVNTVAIHLAGNFFDNRLTPREIQVLELLRDGNRDKEIAQQLSISEPTVHFHIGHVVGKLQARNRTHAVILAMRRGLLSLES